MSRERHTFTMTLSLSVVDHLGLNLYSNVPAVLSELVANAWDADASEVRITVDSDDEQIVIEDDGHGMRVDDVNHKFLMVGYRRRQEDGGSTSPGGRHVMGRKGIGKLSTFSIADEVQVETAVVDEKVAPCGFIMKTGDIRRAIGQNESEAYHPQAIDPGDIDLERGTRLTLRQLKKRVTRGTVKHLRRRLARRFSVLGQAHGFEVLVDGVEIGMGDRDYFKNLQYLWSIGEAAAGHERAAESAEKKQRIRGVIDVAALCEDEDLPAWRNLLGLQDVEPTAGKDAVLEKLAEVCGNERGELEVSGWIGTFREQANIDEGNNSVVILAWGKLIHEDILKDVKAGGLYTKYLIGEIQADFLDLDAIDDIVTSNRQSLKEDDPRFTLFRRWVSGVVLRAVERNWRDWRRDAAMQRARNDSPAVEAWYGRLSPDSKKFARKLFGEISAHPVDNDDDGAVRRQLYRNTILAFERLKLRETLSKIDEMGGTGFMGAFRALFDDIDELEAAEYHQIARGRLEVVRRFENIIDEDEKERVVQEHLFDHLWLLDPSWERGAVIEQQMEKRVEQIFGEVTARLTDEERRGRVDIAVRSAANKYVIIELKRFGASVAFWDLQKQLIKYRDAFHKVLRERFPGESRPVELIAVLGRPPTGTDDQQTVTNMLREMEARWVSYDSLITNAQRTYSDYLQAQRRLSRVAELLEAI